MAIITGVGISISYCMVDFSLHFNFQSSKIKTTKLMIHFLNKETGKSTTLMFNIIIEHLEGSIELYKLHEINELIK